MKTLWLCILGVLASCLICSSVGICADGTATDQKKTISAADTAYKKVSDAVSASDAARQEAAGAEEEIKPPARPADDVTDPVVWQKYYKDYVGYVKSMTDVTARGAAWETLAQDIYTMSRSHPERITAGAIDSVMNELALELKEKYRNADYKLDVSAAQKYVVDAALNFVKSNAFQDMTDNEQSAVGHYFMALSLELSWRSEFNAANKDLYPKIAEFFKTMLENGSVDDKALAFRQLMHLFRVDVWGSKEGNREVAEQILKTALNIDGGIQGLVNAWMKGIGDSSLVDEARAHIADALSQVIWQHEWLNNASRTKISDAQLDTLSEKVTVFLKGVHDGSIEISPAYRNSLIHSAGCAVITLMNKDTYGSDAGKALANTHINFTQESLLLDAENGGSVTLQTSAINLMTHVKATAEAKKLDGVAEKCKDVLLHKDFDAANYTAKARNEMKTTTNADHAAFVGQGLANIEKIHLAAKTEKIDAASIKATIADIKAWLADPNHLKDMRIMQWQQALYEALAALVKEISQDDSGVVLESAMQDDIFEIFSTVPGLKDSLVKELATKDAAGMATTLRANGFKELASKIEAVFCLTSEALLTKMWSYYNDKDFVSAEVFANEVIARYTEDALDQQASLKDFAPQGQEAKYWALNDVGTAHFALGEIAGKTSDKDEARKQYNIAINKFQFAQCWDPQGWYWKVAQAAKEALKNL